MEVGKYQMAEILGCYTDKMLKKGARKDLQCTIDEAIENQVGLF